MTEPGLLREPGRGRVWAWVAGACVLAVVALAGVQIATWPDVAELAHRNPETTAFIEQYRQGRRAGGQSDAVRWEWTPDERISPHLKRAVVAAEDMEFFAHRGFSSAELKDALTQALKKLQAPRGASTITQQLAKNLWLSPSRSPLRKLKEALLTRQLERHLSKRRILELYLNVVEFGPGIYGAEAAARHYFGASTFDLTEHEAAQLAATLPRPATWHPGRGSQAYARYVAEIERRMDVASFLWRAVGAEPPGPELAINLDSLIRLLQDTLGLAAPDSTAQRADSDTTGVMPEADSVQAVSAAVDALRAATALPQQWLIVNSFTRDSVGYLIELVPATAADTVMGSGGVVRVWSDGTATVIRLHR